MNFAERMKHHHDGIRNTAHTDHPFLRDRTLYDARGLGTVSLCPAQAEAGARTPVTLTFVAGPLGLPEGAALRALVVGYNPMPMLAAAPGQPGQALVEVSTDAKAEWAMEIVNGFCHREARVVLTRGGVRPGERIEFRFGRDGALALSELARPLRFLIEVRDDAKREKWRTVDRAILDVRPGVPVSVACSAEPVARVGEATPVTVRVLDRYGNATAHAAQPRWDRDSNGMVNEDGAVVVGAPGVCRLRGRDRSTGLPILSSPLKRLKRAPEYRLAFGDIHCHDFLSPGLASPREYYEMARAMGLHFLALPIQTQGGNLTEMRWTIANFMAEEYYRPGEFVTFPAFEWQNYAFGHKNVYFATADQPFLCPYDRRYDTPAKLFRALRKSDALVAAHHVGYKLNVHVPGTDWTRADETLQPVAEICSCHGSSEMLESERPLNAPGQGLFMRDAWAAGHHVGVIGGSDSHSGLPVNSPREPRSYPGGLACVYTREITRRGIFEALRNRRCYATTGARMILEFEVNGRTMGSVAGDAGRKRKIHGLVAGTAPLREVTIQKNNRTVYRVEPKGMDTEFEWTDSTGPELREDWYDLKVVQSDGELGWSSPVWVGKQEV